MYKILQQFYSWNLFRLWWHRRQFGALKNWYQHIGLTALNLHQTKHTKEGSTMFHLKIKTWMEWKGKGVGASEFRSATKLLINSDPKTKIYKYKSLYGLFEEKTLVCVGIRFWMCNKNLSVNKFRPKTFIYKSKHSTLYLQMYFFVCSLCLKVNFWREGERYKMTVFASSCIRFWRYIRISLFDRSGLKTYVSYYAALI